MGRLAGGFLGGVQLPLNRLRVSEMQFRLGIANL